MKLVDLNEVDTEDLPPCQQRLHCFDNAWKEIMRLEKAGESDDTNLIHAMVTNAEGRTFPHGWLEKGAGGVENRTAYDLARDANNPVVMNAAKYRKAIKAENIFEYDPVQAMIQGAKNRNYGPWEPSLV